MPVNFPVGSLDKALDGLITGTGGTYVSLHTGNPGTTGASELSGGSPAYARKSVTWNASSNGVKSANPVTLDIPPARTITHFGVWSTTSGASGFVGGGPLRNAAGNANISEAYTEQGQYALTARLTIDDIAVT